MERIAYLDTHAVVWLHMGESSLIGEKGKSCLKTHELHISPVVLLELQCLYETKKTNYKPKNILKDLGDSMGLTVCQKDFTAVVNMALTQQRIRDPFDRIIVAHAAIGRDPLITRDSHIHQHYSKAVWD